MLDRIIPKEHSLKNFFLSNQVWLPPTPPVDDGDELYVDIMLDMAYDTSSVITPAELASIAPFRLGYSTSMQAQV